MWNIRPHYGSHNKSPYNKSIPRLVHLLCPHFRYHSQGPISFHTCSCQHCYLLLTHEPWLSSCPVLTEETIVQPRNLETRYQELGSSSWDLLEEWGPEWQSQKDPMPPAVFLGLDLPTLSLINFFLSNSSRLREFWSKQLDSTKRQ